MYISEDDSLIQDFYTFFYIYNKTCFGYSLHGDKEMLLAFSYFSRLTLVKLIIKF